MNSWIAWKHQSRQFKRCLSLFAKHHEHFRRALVRRFPFSVFYTIEDKEIVVHAIFDNRQDPEKLP